MCPLIFGCTHSRVSSYSSRACRCDKTHQQDRSRPQLERPATLWSECLYRCEMLSGKPLLLYSPHPVSQRSMERDGPNLGLQQLLVLHISMQSYFRPLCKSLLNEEALRVLARDCLVSAPKRLSRQSRPIRQLRSPSKPSVGRCQ